MCSLSLKKPPKSTEKGGDEEKRMRKWECGMWNEKEMGEVWDVELGPAVVPNERDFRLRSGFATTSWRRRIRKAESFDL